MNEVDIGSIGCFNFPNFLNMMLRKVDEINAEEEIRRRLHFVKPLLSQSLHNFG